MKHLLQPENGKLNFVSKELFLQDVLQYEGNLVEITVKRKRKDRSTPQNAYYFGVCIPIALIGFLDLGNKIDAKGVHQYFKKEFLSYEKEITLKTGEVIVKEFVGSTTELNTKEFSDYLESIVQFCAENLDCVIPLPTKQNENETF